MILFDKESPTQPHMRYVTYVLGSLRAGVPPPTAAAMGWGTPDRPKFVSCCCCIPSTSGAAARGGTPPSDAKQQMRRTWTPWRPCAKCDVHMTGFLKPPLRVGLAAVAGRGIPHRRQKSNYFCCGKGVPNSRNQARPQTSPTRTLRNTHNTKRLTTNKKGTKTSMPKSITG